MSDRATIIAQRKQVISETFGGALAGLGFVPIEPMVWSRALNDSIRRIVSLTGMKGGCVSPRWGYWLAYVPVIKGDRLASKGKNDGTAIDLIFDPIDYDAGSGSSQWLVSVEPFGAGDLRLETRRVSRRTVEECTAFFSPVKGLVDLPAEFERKKVRPHVRFGWGNYVIEPLAYAFTLAKLEQAESAKAMLESWIEDRGERLAPATCAKAKALLEAALSGHGNE